MKWIISLGLLALASLAHAEGVTHATYDARSPFDPLLLIEGVTHATYDLYYRGTSAGILYVTVTRKKARTYYEARAEPNWVAQLFGIDTITERGTVDNASHKPLEYFYHDAHRNRHYKYVYDWPHRQVVVTTAKEQFTVGLGSEIEDPASMALRLLRELPTLKPNYSVLSRGKLQVYRFRAPEPTTIQVQGDSRPVWKVVRERGDADKTRITTWHDDSRGYWMVRTARTENGKETVRLELAELRETGLDP